MYCSLSGTTPLPFPSGTDNYQVEVEANIIDKGYTLDGKIYYDYLGNRAAVNLAHRDSYESWTKYIYSYKTDEIFTITSGIGMCSHFLSLFFLVHSASTKR